MIGKSLAIIFPLPLAFLALATEPPAIPIGLDAYRQWECWPMQRIGARAYMRSTYDRYGGNEAADSSHFLYQLSDTNNVTLDIAGPGVLYFTRYNCWHGSPWRYEVDGQDHLVQETATGDPDHSTHFSESKFLPESLFPKPLALTWQETKGADLSWVPIPFVQSFRLGYSRTHYGTGYYIYDLYDRSARLSQPIRSWDAQTPPDPSVIDLLRHAGETPVPAPTSTAGTALQLKETAGEIELDENLSVTVTKLTNAPATVRALFFSVPTSEAVEFGRARLRITWDERQTPSVDTPVALFFGAGTLYNRDHHEYLVKSFPVSVHFVGDRVELACFFPMPFFRSAKIELVSSGGAKISRIKSRVWQQPSARPPSDVGYFHATYRDHPSPERGKDMVLLDTSGVEGSDVWSGNFIGTSFVFSHDGKLGMLEGDPRFFFDDSLTPQAQGTGTEEWGGGGDYWFKGHNTTLPLVGHPCGKAKIEVAKDPADLIESAYRFLLADLMPFGRRAVIQLEHGGADDVSAHYQTVAFWYGAPAPALVPTDDLKIADAASERSHRYDSPQASAPYEITSRYEWGVDTANGKEVYPATSDQGRSTRGASEFSLQLRPDNFGVLLRRKLDYAWPNQRAEVFVAGETNGQAGEFRSAGIWYLAGANTCVFSFPKTELGATERKIETSNRRFRDDEFIIPRDLTRGCSKIRVQIKNLPVTIPLYPGRPALEPTWSEIRYKTYCWVLPEWQP